LYKESGERKEGGDKRCGVMPRRTELNPRLLPTHLPSKLLFMGNSEPSRGRLSLVSSYYIHPALLRKAAP
jgi:hypothetical protein